MRVRLLSPALRQLDDARRLLAQYGPGVARRFQGRLNLAMLRLQRNPQLGGPITEHPESPARQILVHPYRIFYVVSPAPREVLILGIWHVAQLAAEPELPAER